MDDFVMDDYMANDTLSNYFPNAGNTYIDSSNLNMDDLGDSLASINGGGLVNPPTSSFDLSLPSTASFTDFIKNLTGSATDIAKTYLGVQGTVSQYGLLKQQQQSASNLDTLKTQTATTLAQNDLKRQVLQDTTQTALANAAAQKAIAQATTDPWQKWGVYLAVGGLVLAYLQYSKGKK